MAIESLVAFGLATFVLLVISIYANKHRGGRKKTPHKNEHAA